MSNHQRHPQPGEGIGVDDFPLIARTLFDLAVHAAAGLHDPRNAPTASSRRCGPN